MSISLPAPTQETIEKRNQEVILTCGPLFHRDGNRRLPSPAHSTRCGSSIRNRGFCWVIVRGLSAQYKRRLSLLNEVTNSANFRSYTYTEVSHSGSESPVVLIQREFSFAPQTWFGGLAGVQNAMLYHLSYSVRFEASVASFPSAFESFEAVVLDAGQRSRVGENT